jgi:hypothetical protein
MASRRMSEDDGLNQGDVVTTTRITRHVCGNAFTLTNSFAAPKGNHLVFLYLGWQPKDGSETLDVIQVMKDLGWTPPPELEAAHRKQFAEHHANVAADLAAKAVG